MKTRWEMVVQSWDRMTNIAKIASTPLNFRYLDDHLTNFRSVSCCVFISKRINGPQVVWVKIDVYLLRYSRQCEQQISWVSTWSTTCSISISFRRLNLVLVQKFVFSVESVNVWAKESLKLALYSLRYGQLFTYDSVLLIWLLLYNSHCTRQYWRKPADTDLLARTEAVGSKYFAL